MIGITFEEFKNELSEFFNGAVTGGHPDYCNMRCYQELPHNQARKIYKKNFKELWWFMYDFNKIYTAIITYEPKCNNFNLYIEYTSVGYDGGNQTGRTMKVAIACSVASAWTTLSLYCQYVYLGVPILDHNDTYYGEKTANLNFRDGDHPFDAPCEKIAFTRALKQLLEARKHPDREWKGQVIGITLSGQFAPYEYITEIR